MSGFDESIGHESLNIDENVKNDNQHKVDEIIEYAPIIFYDQDITSITILKPRYEDFDLKTLLLTSPLGKSILNYYKVNNKLDNTRRNRLVSIIIKHLYTHIVKK